jgi:uncharacterized OB-fold protein
MKQKYCCLLIEQDYKVGDPPPEGYLEWHQWARIQMKGGLRSKKCRRCARWYFPQEMDSHVCKP